MDTTTKLSKGSLNSYWKLRGFHRLDAAGRRPLHKAKLGDADTRPRRRFWRNIRLTPKLRLLRKLSPRRLITSVRDAYVSIMLSLSSSRAFVGYGYGSGVEYSIKEYDQRVLVELYKSILAEGTTHGGVEKGLCVANSGGADVSLRR